MRCRENLVTHSIRFPTCETGTGTRRGLVGVTGLRDDSGQTFGSVGSTVL